MLEFYLIGKVIISKLKSRNDQNQRFETIFKIKLPIEHIERTQNVWT